MHIASFERFDLKMTMEQAQSISIPGQNAMCAVVELLQDFAIDFQFGNIEPQHIRDELVEYGAWDEEELSSIEDNKQRILWIAGGNICEAVRIMT